MNRRTALNHLVILSIGAAVLPSCGQPEQSTIKLKNLSLDKPGEDLLVQLTDAIIPARNFMGDGQVKAHHFTLLMVDDCYAPEKQASFMAGLTEFDKFASLRQGSRFTACTPKQKNALLTELESKKSVPENALYFYETTRRHTIQAYTTSRDYMTNVLHYKMVPGSDFKGCVPV